MLQKEPVTKGVLWPPLPQSPAGAGQREGPILKDKESSGEAKVGVTRRQNSQSSPQAPAKSCPLTQFLL